MPGYGRNLAAMSESVRALIGCGGDLRPPSGGNPEVDGDPESYNACSHHRKGPEPEIRMDASNRHAILLAVHRLPDQVRRLASRLRHPRVDLFLHVDAKVDSAPFQASGLTPVRRRFDVAWNGFGLVALTLDWLRSHGASGKYSTFTYLSGQDYPLRPIAEIVDAFDAGDDLLLDTQWSRDPDRASRWNRFHVTDPRPWVRLRDRARRKFVPANRGIRRPPTGLEILCGSALWTLSAESVAWMLAFLENRPEIEAFFRNTLHSDEFFYQSVLSASPFAGRLGRHRHFIDWSRGAPHPEILDLRHLEAIRASGMLFARKFDPVASADLLERIDAELLGATAPGEAPTQRNPSFFLSVATTEPASSSPASTRVPK